MRRVYESRAQTRLSPAEYSEMLICDECHENEHHTDFGDSDAYCIACERHRARDEAESARQDAAFERAAVLS